MLILKSISGSVHDAVRVDEETWLKCHEWSLWYRFY